MQKNFLIILGIFSLFTCNDRRSPVDTGNDSRPDITVVPGTRWFDFDHTTGIGAIKLDYRASDPELPHDTCDFRVYLCSTASPCREISPVNDSTSILDGLTPGVIWSCSLHVSDSRNITADTVIPIPLPALFPPQPPVPVLSTGDSVVTIRWNAVAGATGYAIYQAGTGAGPYQLKGTVTQPATGTGTATTFTGPADAYSSQFHIIASVNDAGECRSRDTLFSRQISRDMTAPTIDAVSKGTFAGHIRLCLHANDTTTSRFELYRSFSADGPFQPAASFPAVNSKNCFDDIIATAAVFYYKAASIDRQGRSGPLSAAEYGFLLTNPAAVPVVRAEGWYDHNALYWNAVQGAREYAVYRSADTCPDGMARIALTTTLVYRDSVAAIDKFFYAVAAIDSLGHEVAMSGCAAAGRSRMPGPPGFAVSDGTFHDSIVLSWGAVPGVDFYTIYRSPTTCPTFDDTIAHTTQPRFVDSDVGKGYYSYTVSAVDIGGREGLMSLCRRGSTAPAPAPTDLKVSFEANPDFITLSWDTLGGTGYYVIYRSAGSCSSEMKKIDSTGANGYTDAVSTSATYYYRVAAVDSNGIEGSMSDCGRGRVSPLPAPTGLKASIGTYVGRIRISWDPVLGADGYIVYKGSSNVAEFSIPLDTVTSLYKFDEEIDAPLQYYWVAARNALGAGTRSGYVYGRALQPPELTVQNDSGPIVLAWNSDPAISTTLLFRANDTSGYECIDSTPLSPLTVTLPDYHAYFFEILTKTTTGDSCFSYPVMVSLPIPAPTGLSANITADTVHLLWNAVPGTLGYSVYRSTIITESLWYIDATTTDTSCIEIITAPGHYYYRVSAENSLRESALSDTAGVRVDSLPFIPASEEHQPTE